MKNFFEFPVPDTDSASRCFVVELYSDASSKIIVRSCQLYSTKYKNQTSFTDESGLHDIFCQPLASEIENNLGRLCGKSEVISIPDFIFELPGVTLHDLNIIVTKMTSGALQISLRFNTFYGGINNIFQNHIGFDDFVSDHNDRVATQLLADLALPILNIISSIQSMRTDRGFRAEEILVPLAERAEEIGFQIELISRFVKYSDVRKTADFSSAPDYNFQPYRKKKAG